MNHALTCAPAPFAALLGILLLSVPGRSPSGALRAAPPPAPDPAACTQPWRKPYAGPDATGAHVIGLWQFEKEAELEDGSGRGHRLQLKGARIRPDGRTGPCLESGPGWPVKDERHAALAVPHRSLSPKGAFTLEMWIRPGPGLDGYPEAFLVDKKYVADTDYQLVLGAADKSGARRLVARLGFGDGSESYTSEPARYETGAWTHVAFVYDGAGQGRFFRDGAALGATHKPGRGAVAPGAHPLSIGDRISSYYHGFPGSIAQVRLCGAALEFRPAKVTLEAGRSVFVRREKAHPLRFAVTNLGRAVVASTTLEFVIEGRAAVRVDVKDLGGGATRTIEYAFDTSLRPDTYTLRARLVLPGDTPYSTEETFPVTLVARPLPHRMPVVMWGVTGAESVIRELPRLKEIGFTHCLGLSADTGRIFAAGAPGPADSPERIAEARQMLDLALANRFGILATLSPGHWAESRKEFLRVDRQGHPCEKRPAVCALFPELQALCRDVGASVAQTYGDHPAFHGALLHTELRDGANCCFHEHDRAACRKATGADVPPEVSSKAGVDYATLKGFPAERVIPDDHPILRYLRWYWKEGDGWCGLNTELHRGLKTAAGRADLWTFHDPAVRVASTFGSGGDVDVVSQWTYSYPDPIRIALPTDELFAMARGASRPQRVMKMTQIIWYRAQTAPIAKSGAPVAAPRSPWEDTDPDAAFPTIAPMHLREAFWAKIARPVQGIMYHGWQALVPTESTGGYRYTHPQTRHELRRLIREVVEPLGPTLLQVPDRRADVAFLESFASQMFARRGGYGWAGGWGGDVYLALQYAGLQPEVIYDETIATRGLDGVRLLILADCDVLTAGVVARIAEFRKRGGLVVGDERLCPAVEADVTIQSRKRTGQADEDRTALVATGAELRRAIGTRYRRYADSSNPDVVARVRTRGGADYLFCVNDRREFGAYVGRHRLVMENGLPSDATLSVARAAGAVYDLVERRPAPFTSEGGQLRIPVALGPCEGRVFLVTERPIAAVRIDGPESVSPGGAASIRVTIVDGAGDPLDAVIPLEVEIRDPSGRDAESSGFYGACDGVLEIPLDIAPNDEPGLWQIRARELASGRVATRHFRVAGSGGGAALP